MTKPRLDVHAHITDRIVAMIDAGAGEFRMPWHRSAGMPLHMPANTLTKKRYRGINVISLWMAAEQAGYASNQWGTYKQWQARSAQVRAGERGSLVVVYKEFNVAPDENDERDDGRRMFARASWVFNAQQVDGAEQPDTTTAPDQGRIARIAAADQFIAATGADIRHGGERAFYTPAHDYIQLPAEALFLGDDKTRADAYYATAFHELTHWTGAPARLDRAKGRRFGDPAYALEELVAELGAAFLCAATGIANEPRRDHAQYIANWLQALKNDKRAIFTAAAAASAAVDHLEQRAAPPAQMAA